jgi:hypothetical protein
MAAVPERTRTELDSIMHAQGSYVVEEGVYRFVLPREAATILRDWQSLSPNLGFNSWIAFSSAVHQEAIVVAELLILPDEVDAVMNSALSARLEITGLAESSSFFGRRLYTLDLNGVGTFADLAHSIRATLDQIENSRRLAATKRRHAAGANLPEVSSIDAGPINEALSVRGTVRGGVYMAAIGRRALLRGEQVGREMGMSTWVSISGSNDHALARGEVLASTDELQNVLKALRAKNASVAFAHQAWPTLII